MEVSRVVTLTEARMKQFRPFHRGSTTFATWCSGDRDPWVAYLDQRQLVVGTAELTTGGWSIWPDGAMYTPSGYENRGPIERAVLHRISHTLDEFLHEPSLPCVNSELICDVADADPPMRWAARSPSRALGFGEGNAARFELSDSHAIQLVPNGDWLARAVYVDEDFLLEAGMVVDRSIRVWPPRALAGHVADLAPSPAEAGAAIERIHVAIVQGRE